MLVMAVLQLGGSTAAMHVSRVAYLSAVRVLPTPNYGIASPSPPQLAPGGVGWAVNERQSEALIRAGEALQRVQASIAGGLCWLMRGIEE